MCWISSAEAAAMLHITPQSLRRWRSQGKGPSYVKIGNKVLYERDTVIQWIDVYGRRPPTPVGVEGAGRSG